MGEYRLHLIPRQHHRQALGPFGLDDVIKPRQFDLQNLAIQEQNRGQCLILRRSGNLALDCKMRQKHLHLWRPHLARMTQAVKPNEKTHPLDIRVFGTYAVVQPPDLVTELIQQFWRLGNWGCLHF